MTQIECLAYLVETANVRSPRWWLSAMGTLSNAMNGFSPASNSVTGKLPVVDGSYVSFAVVEKLALVHSLNLSSITFL